MALRPLDRKAELVRRGVKVADIAHDVQCSPSHVSTVLSGKRRHEPVERAIAERLGMELEAVFPQHPLLDGVQAA